MPRRTCSIEPLGHGDPSNPPRRQVLAAIGMAGVGGIAGCLDDGGGSDPVRARPGRRPRASDRSQAELADFPMLEDVSLNALVSAFPAELEKNHARYDEEAALLTRPPVRGGPMAHGEPVHPLRPSLSYAVALLDTGRPSHRERAIEIIREVLPHQNTRPASMAFGVWPYYAHQSIERLHHVDLNWAVFMGRELVYALTDHAERLPSSLVSDIESALRRAAESGADRDVIPGYTNIAFMTCFVVRAAGELLGDDHLLTAGREALRDLVGYTRFHGEFTEFNSPTYTIIALAECGRMLGDFDASEDRARAAVLNDYLWRSIARQYHPSTATLAGPHSRAYDDEFHEDVGGTSLRSIIHAGTGGAIGGLETDELVFFENEPPLDLNWHKTVLDCPERYYEWFDGAGPAFVRTPFYRGNTDDRPAADLTPLEFPGPVEARTFATEAVSLGTFTRSHCWGQRRPIVGIWGDRDAPSYVRVRVLRDGSDYLPAVLTASQHATHVVGGLGFLTDYFTGGRETFTDLRLRFEVGTKYTRSTEDITVAEHSRAGALIEAGDVAIDIELLHLAFGDATPSVRVTEGEQHEGVRPSTGVDVVLSGDDRTTVDFDELDRAAVLFGLSLRHHTLDAEPVTYATGEPDGDYLTAWIEGPEVPRSVRIPPAPTTYAEYAELAQIDPSRLDGAAA